MNDLHVVEVTIPGKMYYIDCKTLDQDQIELSWGWPLALSDGQTDASYSDVPSYGSDKTVTHAVIEFKEKGEIKRVTTSTSPYIFTGKSLRCIMIWFITISLKCCSNSILFLSKLLYPKY